MKCGVVHVRPTALGDCVLGFSERVLFKSEYKQESSKAAAVLIMLLDSPMVSTSFEGVVGSLDVSYLDHGILRLMPRLVCSPGLTSFRISTGRSLS